MSVLGLWGATGRGATPLATISASDGNPRPSPFAFAPDGRSVYYHCTTNGDGGLQGCVVPLERGALFWMPCHVTTDHPYAMARGRFRRTCVRRSAEPRWTKTWTQWIEDPVWTPDGKFLIGSNAICVDAETRAVVWHKPAAVRRAQPGRPPRRRRGRRRPVLPRRGHRPPRGGPFPLDKPCALRWAAGRPDRLAVLTTRSDTAEPAVHIFDAEECVGSATLPHPQWQDGKRWSGDRNAWVWAPDGEGAAVLADEGAVECGRSPTPPMPNDCGPSLPAASARCSGGADDTLVTVGGRRIRFVRAETAAPPRATSPSSSPLTNPDPWKASRSTRSSGRCSRWTRTPGP
ncbi:hypothetical protein ACU686_42360 [Yinghuangia aomiensis]